MADAASSSPANSAGSAEIQETPSVVIQRTEDSLRQQSMKAVQDGTRAVISITKQLPMTQEGEAAQTQLANMVGALNTNMAAVAAFGGFWDPFKKQYVSELWEQVSHCVQLQGVDEIDVGPLLSRCQAADTSLTSMIASLDQKKEEFAVLPSFNNDHTAFAQSLLPLVKIPISVEQSKQMDKHRNNLKDANSAQCKLQMERANLAKKIANLECEHQLLEALTVEAEGDVQNLSDLKARSARFKAQSDERDAQEGVSNRSFGFWIWGRSNPSTEHQKKMADAMHAQAEASVVKAQKERKDLAQEKSRIAGEIEKSKIMLADFERQCEAQKTDIESAQALVDKDQEILRDLNAKFGGKTPQEIINLGNAIEELMNPDEDRAQVTQNQHRVKPFIIQTLESRRVNLVKLKQIWGQLSSDQNHSDDPEEFTWNCTELLQQAYEILMLSLATDMSVDPEAMQDAAKSLGNLSLASLDVPKRQRPKKKAIQAS